ncbi:MAG TPA: peptide MFS transporter [Woeseiaceae bacterium]|nr:peptide MFS transporter [Woeseiaceae bacterium]
MNVATTAGAAPEREVLGHPRGLVTLFFTEMWERFSYYGMRALLVLFMTDQVVNGGMDLTDAKATAIYGIYTAAVYLVALPGGWIADRLLGAQRAVFIGGIIIMSGHFVLAVPSVYAFFSGLLLVVLGTGLLKPNVSAVVGELYAPGDPRRDGGFTIFYMGINVGALLGPLVCGTLGQSATFGWHYGFAAAGVGMLFGVIQFRLTKQYLGTAGLEPHSTGDPARDARIRRRAWTVIAAVLGILAVVVALAMAGVISFQPERLARRTTYVIVGMAVLYFAWIFMFGHLDRMEKRRMIVIIALFIGAAMFWSGFEQAGSSLNIFADRYTQLEFDGFTLFSTWFQSLNSMFIIIFAPVFAWMWVSLAKRNLNPSTPAKFGFGLLGLALGFLTMVGASMIVADGGKALPTWLIFTYLFHTFGELALSPVGLSATTKLAPKRYVGQMMGIWFLGTALGNLIAGQIAGEFDPNDLQAFPAQYWQIVLTTGGTGIIFLIFTKPLKKLMDGIT